MILDVRHLEMVQAIEKEGTLTEAARKLGISQPAMGRQLAGLEREIGAPMFRRHHKGMTLTREGRRILESARRVLDDLTRAEEDVRLLTEGYAGTLRVATECYTCYHWLPWVARRFGERYPKVELQLVPDATRDPYAALTTGAVDLALVYSAPPEADAEVDVALEEVFADELVAIVAEKHPLADEPYMTAEQFRDETLLCHYVPPTEPWSARC
jgi:LysR family transcriptional regulator for metE and metH